MKIDCSTSLYGVLGYPLSHSLSPEMQNAGFRASGYNGVYLAFESKDLEGCIQGIRALDIKGLSITIPYKECILPFLDEVDDVAQKIGAVNTLVNRKGRLVGYNTDAIGAIRALEQQLTLPGKDCLIIGAGGAARAIGFALKERGVRLRITNRNETRGERLASGLDCDFSPLSDMGRIQADLVVQATSVGMYPNLEKPPISPKALEKGTVVMDIIYNPLETRLLAGARERGCITISGVEMFLHQGAEQFELWTDLKAPLEVMRDAVLSALEQRRHENR